MPIYPLGGWGQQRTVGGTGSTNVDQIARNAAANALAAAMAAQAEADANEAKLTTIESGATADQTPDEIRDELQTLTGTDRLDASAVQNIPAGTTLVIHDPTLTGEGNTGDPLTVTTPFTSAEETKLAGIEQDATADQTAEEIRDDLQTLMGDERLAGASVKDSVDQIARTEAQTAQTDAATASQEATTAQTTADTNLAKLNTVESGATADQTAEEVRDLLQTLAGIDRLDGNSIRDIIDVTARSIASTARATAIANATKLAGIEDHATADQTDAEIRDALQALMGTDRLAASAIQGLPVNTLRFGAGVPVDTLGTDDDVWWDTTAGSVYQRDSGAYVLRYTDMVGAGVGITQAQYDALVARVAALEGGGGTPPSMHTRYFGWSLDRVIETSDLLTANTSQTDEGVFPDTTVLMYAYYVVPEAIGHPDEIYLGDNSVDQSGIFGQLAGTIDDPLGEAHVAGITFDLQAPVTGEAIRLVYTP